MARPCSFCHQPSRDGLASIYWAYYPGPNDRKAYRTKLCPGCVADTVVPIMGVLPMDREMHNDTSCVACGAGTANDENYLYAKCYWPGADGTDVEALLCGACMAVWTARLQTEGFRLPDRDPSARAREAVSPAWALLAG